MNIKNIIAVVLFVCLFLSDALLYNLTDFRGYYIVLLLGLLCNINFGAVSWPIVSLAFLFTMPLLHSAVDGLTIYDIAFFVCFCAAASVIWYSRERGPMALFSVVSATAFRNLFVLLIAYRIVFWAIRVISSESYIFIINVDPTNRFSISVPVLIGSLLVINRQTRGIIPAWLRPALYCVPVLAIFNGSRVELAMGLFLLLAAVGQKLNITRSTGAMVTTGMLALYFMGQTLLQEIFSTVVYRNAEGMVSFSDMMSFLGNDTFAYFQYSNWRLFETALMVNELNSFGFLEVLIGKGYGAFISLGGSYFLAGEFYSEINRLHNGFLYMLFQTGLIGLGLIVGFAFSYFRSWRGGGNKHSFLYFFFITYTILLTATQGGVMDPKACTELLFSVALINLITASDAKGLKRARSQQLAT